MRNFGEQLRGSSTSAINAAARPSITISGSGSGWVEIRLTAPTTFDDRTVTVTGGGRFIGLVLDSVTQVGNEYEWIHFRDISPLSVREENGGGYGLGTHGASRHLCASSMGCPSHAWSPYSASLAAAARSIASPIVQSLRPDHADNPAPSAASDRGQTCWHSRQRHQGPSATAPRFLHERTGQRFPRAADGRS